MPPNRLCIARLGFFSFIFLLFNGLSAQISTGVTTIGANGGGSRLAPCTEILRFDNYNDNIAGGTGGQNFVFILDSGDSLFFNLQRTGFPINAVAAPSTPNSDFGLYGYTGLAGFPVLYQTDNVPGDDTRLLFSNIILKGRDGNFIPDFTIMVFDGEQTGDWEYFTLAAPRPFIWTFYDSIAPDVANYSKPVATGLGTDTVTMIGTSLTSSGKYLIYGFSIQSPPGFQIGLGNNDLSNGLQGMALGINRTFGDFLNDTSVCGGGALILNAAITGATYIWQDNSTGPTYTVTESGVYIVKVSLSGCFAIDSFQVEIGNAGPITITGDTTICANDSTRICAPEGYTSYQWNVGGSSSCIEAKQAGDYYVTVTGADGCSAQSNQVLISVYPVPSVSIVVQGDTLSSFGSVSYHWILNGVLLNNATSSVYIAKEPGLYSVEVTDTSGCTIISNPVNLTNGISDLEEEDVSIFPNPSTGSWQLTVGSELIGSKLEVYDEEGRIVFQSEIRNPKSEISLNVASGIYWLQVSSFNFNITRKLMKL